MCRKCECNLQVLNKRVEEWVRGGGMVGENVVDYDGKCGGSCPKSKIKVHSSSYFTYLN